MVAILSGVVTFGEQKSFTNRAGASFFSEIRNGQHKIGKITTFYLHSICIDCVLLKEGNSDKYSNTVNN